MSKYAARMYNSLNEMKAYGLTHQSSCNFSALQRFIRQAYLLENQSWLRSLMQQGISEPVFYGDLDYQLKGSLESLLF